MSNSSFEQIRKIIQGRRTTKVGSMNGRRISDETINQLLELADWAPTHAHTEPWRFFVYTDEALRQFGQMHADLYWEHTPEERRNPATPDKLRNTVEKPSHLIVVATKRAPETKIPVIEEISAASAAVQNILLGAEALGLAAMWNTGGMAHHKALKQHLGLSDEDNVLGFIYLGYTDEERKEGTRKVPLTDKVQWMK